MRLMDSMNSLDATVSRLGDELLDRENMAIDQLDVDRNMYQDAIDELRNAILYEIKDLVWRLGYTQGYHYGAHDGHDHEIKEQIAKLKDDFEAFVQGKLQTFHTRVAKEFADGDAANDAAREELDAEFVRLTQEMEDALAAAVASFEETLAECKEAMNDNVSGATDALEEFIAGRLAVWADLAQ
jgi:uncharacterized phage infection (PIP) family protein YhgE